MTILASLWVVLVKRRKRSPKFLLFLIMCDEDMAPSDTNIDYKVSSFLYLHSDFWYNLLGSTCTCYLNVGTNMSQSASPSKLNF
jgi:hypothetical protein